LFIIVSKYAKGSNESSTSITNEWGVLCKATWQDPFTQEAFNGSALWARGTLKVSDRYSARHKPRKNRIYSKSPSPIRRVDRFKLMLKDLKKVMSAE
jgi:hypothetical protein